MDEFQFQRLNDYETDWLLLAKDRSADAIGEIFDYVALPINELTESLYNTPDEISEKYLFERPEVEIKGLNDGYELEAEKLLAIQQRNSRGFQVYDVNPGLLTPLEYPLNLPYEFLFDGTNFLNNQNGSFTENFRTVNIPIQGNFLKIEFINEVNGFSNSIAMMQETSYIPSAEIKYESAFQAPAYESQPEIGQTSYSLDIYARTKIYLDFGTNSGKPHLIGQSGKIFKTYFSEINLHLNIGAPKIRVTVGFNSEVYESQSSAPINSKLHLAGSSRLLNDIDTVLSPFSLCENDNDFLDSSGSNSGKYISGTALITNTVSVPVIINDGGTLDLSDLTYRSVGYSVLWITQLSFRQFPFDTALTDQNGYWFTAELVVGNGITRKRVFRKFMRADGNDVVVNFAEPVRVVIPSGNSLFLRYYFGRSTSGSTGFKVSYDISGYSLGELVVVEVSPTINEIKTSKFITDAVFLSDINRVQNV